MRRIYLDNNATTAVHPEVLEAMYSCWSGPAGNASSQHQEGRCARRILDTARDTIAELLDASPEQILFTSGGTEANNLAILGLAGESPAHLVTSSVEHPSVLGCFELLEKRGCRVTRLAVDGTGIVQPSEFLARLHSDTRLASVMLANNEVGAIEPVEELARAARQRNIWFHCDAVQAVGKIAVSFRQLGVSTLSLSGHKFHGPSGIGALLVRDPKLLDPLLVGGHQEFGLRPGTEPIALVSGMAKALKIAVEQLDSVTTGVRRLRDQLEAGIRQRIPGVVVNGPAAPRIPNTLNLQFPGLDGPGAVIALDLLGVACSTGSACSSGATEASPVLLAMGLSRSQARSSLRFSLSRFTTAEEVQLAIEQIARVYEPHGVETGSPPPL